MVREPKQCEELWDGQGWMKVVAGVRGEGKKLGCQVMIEKW